QWPALRQHRRDARHPATIPQPVQAPAVADLPQRRGAQAPAAGADVEPPDGGGRGARPPAGRRCEGLGGDGARAAVHGVTLRRPADPPDLLAPRVADGGVRAADEETFAWGDGLAWSDSLAWS